MTAQHLLPFAESEWRIPHWCYDLGYVRSSRILHLIKKNADILHRAELDGIERVAPILLAMGCSPREARQRVGKAVWKVAHHSDLHLNLARAEIMIWANIGLPDLIHFPRGALREAKSKMRATSREAVIAAGRIAKTRTEFREAVMLAHDTKRMGGNIDLKWSLRRLREGHDRLAMEFARAKSDPTPWREPWACKVDGFKFTMLNSMADFSAEGLTQRHCVASYASEAKEGRYIIMRIDGKERATVRFGGHPVRVLEVRGRYNADVSEACRRACAKVCAEHLTSERKKNTTEGEG